jgi:hypothetical protein
MIAPAYSSSDMPRGTSVPATTSSTGSWPSDTVTGARPSRANHSRTCAAPCLPASMLMLAARPSFCTCIRYAPALSLPVSGSVVNTAQPVPTYRPPSPSCHFGTGKSSRFALGDEMTCCVTNPESTSRTGYFSALATHSFGRLRSASTSARSSRSVPSRSVMPSLPRVRRAPGQHPQAPR